MFLLGHVTADEYRAKYAAFKEAADTLELSPADRHFAWAELTADEYCREWPVPPEEFFIGPGAPYYVGTNVLVRPLIGDLLCDFFDAASIAEVLLLVAGIGAGKSYGSSLALTYVAYLLSCLRDPQRYLNGFPGVSLSADAEIVMVNSSAAGANQAGKIVFSDTAEKIENSPYFQLHFAPYAKAGELLFDHRIRLASVTSKWESMLGWNLFAFVIDEAAFGIESERADYVRELFLAGNQRRRSRFGHLGLGAMLTSPGSEYGFIETLAADGAWDKAIMVRRFTTWEAKGELVPGARIFLLDSRPESTRIVEEDLIFQGFTEDGLYGEAARANGERVRWRVHAPTTAHEDEELAVAA